MVFKFWIVLIFIVKVKSEEHTVVGVASGRSLCKGTLQIIPPLQRRNELIDKFEKENFMDNFSQVIKKNRKKNNLAFTYISVTGQCCWETCDRFGTCDSFGPGDEKSPRGQFIKSIKGFECT